MEWHKFISAPGSVSNIPVATSHLAKALGEREASRKRRASESGGETLVRPSPPVTNLSSRASSNASEKTTSTPPGFLRACLQGLPNPDHSQEFGRLRKNDFPMSTELRPTSGRSPQRAALESDEYRSTWRIFISSFQNGPPDCDAANMMSQSNTSHEDSSTTDFGIRNSPTTKQQISRFFQE